MSGGSFVSLAFELPGTTGVNFIPGGISLGGARDSMVNAGLLWVAVILGWRFGARAVRSIAKDLRRLLGAALVASIVVSVLGPAEPAAAGASGGNFGTWSYGAYEQPQNGYSAGSVDRELWSVADGFTWGPGVYRPGLGRKGRFESQWAELRGEAMWFYGQIEEVTANCYGGVETAAGNPEQRCIPALYKWSGSANVEHVPWLLHQTVQAWRFFTGRCWTGGADTITAGSTSLGVTAGATTGNDGCRTQATLVVDQTVHSGPAWWGVSCYMGSAWNSGGCGINEIVGVKLASWEMPSDRWKRAVEGGAANNASRYPPGSTFGGGACDAEACPSQAPPSGPPAPQLACGRTMHNMGNGQWFAEVVAMVRNPPSSPNLGYKDVAGSWRTSWDVGLFYGARAMLALPPGAAPGDGYRAQYTMSREFEDPVPWALPPAQEAALPVVEEGDNWLGQEGWISPVDAWNRFVDGVEPFWGGDGGTVSGEDEMGAPLPRTPEVPTNVKRLFATCHLNVDPDPEREGEQVIVVVNLPDNPDDPSPPTDGGVPVESGDACSSSRGGFVGLVSDFVEAVQCALSGLAGLLDIGGLLADFLLSLAEKLLDLFVPNGEVLEDAAEDLAAAFDLSVVGQVTTAVADGIGELLSLGDGGSSGTDACGPEIVPTGFDVSDELQPVGCNPGWDAVEAGFGAGTFGRSIFVAVVWASVAIRIVKTFPWSEGRDAGEPEL